MEKPLDKKAVEALKRLYKTQDGLPFKELDIDEVTFLYLCDNKYISEPNGKIMDMAFDKKICDHEGNVQIEPMGKGYIENLRKARKKENAEHLKYLITTGIAIIALFKSFLPELNELSALILKLLTQ